MTVTDSTGGQTVYTMDSLGRTTGIRLPSSSGGDNISYTYCDSKYSSYPTTAYANNFVSRVVRNNQRWQYSGGPAQSLGPGISTTATDTMESRGFPLSSTFSAPPPMM